VAAAVLVQPHSTRSGRSGQPPRSGHLGQSCLTPAHTARDVVRLCSAARSTLHCWCRAVGPPAHLPWRRSGIGHVTGGCRAWRKT